MAPSNYRVLDIL